MDFLSNEFTVTPWFCLLRNRLFELKTIWKIYYEIENPVRPLRTAAIQKRRSHWWTQKQSFTSRPPIMVRGDLFWGVLSISINALIIFCGIEWCKVKCSFCSATYNWPWVLCSFLTVYTVYGRKGGGSWHGGTQRMSVRGKGGGGEFLAGLSDALVKKQKQKTHILFKVKVIWPVLCTVRLLSP